MDPYIAYKIQPKYGYLLQCSCDSNYFYIISNSSPVINTYYVIAKPIAKAYCAYCNKKVDVFDSDQLIETGKLKWIMV